MATSQKDTVTVCDVSILKTKRVDLVKQIILENVMPSVKPFLVYTQVDAINAERGRDEKIRSMLDILQRQVNGQEYGAFNAFIQSLAGTQPELFNEICGRAPTVTESDFCVKEATQEMKTNIENTKHFTDSELDEQIDFQHEYIELSMVDKGQEVLGHDSQLPHEYNLHLDIVEQKNKSISACDVLVTEGKPNKKVSIYGRAGIGKSTTMQFLAKQWSLGRWAACFTMLFLLQLRFITTQVIAMTTVELLQLYGLYDFPDRSDSTPFTSWLRNCTSRILILIDGLDEIPGFAQRMKNTPRIHDVLQKAHPVDLCVNILRGDLLPGCTVISASRPFVGLSQLPADAKAEILGLTSAKVAEYVEHRHPQHVKNIMSVLSKNTILLSVCSITYYCMLITRLLSEGVTILDEDVATYTRLMAFIISNYCSRKLTDSSFLMDVTSYFSKLAQLAHSGIFELQSNKGLAKIVFDENDLIKSNIRAEDLDRMKRIGIMQVTRRKIGKHESWTAEFFHLSAQELLAVAHFLSHPPFPNDTLHQLFHSGQFNLTLQFIFGLHFDRDNIWIRQICTAVSAQCGSEGIKPKLSSFIDSILKQKLKVCQLIHEGRWKEKAREVVGHIAPGGKLVIERTAMTAIDLLALDYVCHCGGALSSITLKEVHSDATFLNVLLSSLCEHHRDTLQELNLELNSIGAAGAAAIADSLCKMDPESVCNLPILNTLNVSGNNIGDEGAKALGKMLANNVNLSELDVSSNGIGEEGVKTLATGLNQNAGLKVLKLYDNNAAGVGAESLSEMLLQNTCLQELGLSRCRLGEGDVKVLAAGLHRNTTLTELHLYDNEIGAKGVASLAAMLYHNTGLTTLKNNQITDEGAQAIADSLVCNNSLKRLHISGGLFNKTDKIGDAGAIAMAAMLKKNTSLVELHISYNNIGDAGAIAMADTLHSNTSLVELNISHNNIGASGAVAMADMLHKNSCLVGLYMSGNYVGDAGAVAIAGAFCSTGTVADTEDDVEVRRQTWCGCLPSLCREDVGNDLRLMPESTVDDVELRRGAEGGGYNTTISKLDVCRNRIGPAGEKALADVRQHNPHLDITY